MAEMTQARYAKIPLGALADTTLTRTDLAVLGVVAYHARGSRNGSGCYASAARIGEYAGCQRETAARSLKKLVGRGYLIKERVEGRRRCQYHVAEESGEGVTSRSHLEAVGCDEPITPNCDEPITRNRRREYNSAEAGIHGEDDSAEAALRPGPQAPPMQRGPRPPALILPRGWETGDPIEIEEEQMWAYRRRMSQALQDGYEPTEEDLAELDRLVFVASEVNDEDPALHYAFEDLFNRAESVVYPEDEGMQG